MRFSPMTEADLDRASLLDKAKADSITELSQDQASKMIDWLRKKVA